jgi:glycerol transport system ATP-binding protein
VLLDEPLANLDYKLREELRSELPRIFEAGAIFVYATTEPSEALLLGGSTAVYGRRPGAAIGATPEVYRRPDTMEVAKCFPIRR